MPSRAWLVFIVVCLLLAIGAAAIVLVCGHRYAHSFWRHQPVAWTSLLPEGPGVRRLNALASKPVGYPLPAHVTVRSVPVGATLPGDKTRVVRFGTDASPASRTLWTELATLWATTPAGARWTCLAPGSVLHTLRDATPGANGAVSTVGSALVGTLLCTPTTFLTPHYEGLRTQVATRLFVHPDHRRQGYAAHLWHAAFRGHTGVTIWAHPLRFDTPSLGRLPFAPVARVTTMQRQLRPELQPDTDYRSRVVTDTATLPRKCRECSTARVQGYATLEPTPDDEHRAAHWAYVVAHPAHTLLAIEGTEWIHLERLSPDTVSVVGSSYGADTDAVDDKVASASATPTTTTLASHVVAHLQATRQTSASPTLTLVVPSTYTGAFDRVIGPTHKHDAWQHHRSVHVHLHNYRVGSGPVHLPFTLDTLGYASTYA